MTTSHEKETQTGKDTEIHPLVLPPPWVHRYFSQEPAPIIPNFPYKIDPGTDEDFFEPPPTILNPPYEPHPSLMPSLSRLMQAIARRIPLVDKSTPSQIPMEEQLISRVETKLVEMEEKLISHLETKLAEIEQKLIARIEKLSPKG
jgi:hypothetical protein